MDEKQKLYNALVEQNLYSKSFEEFDRQFSSPDAVGRLHSALSEQNLVSLGQDEFQSKYFGVSGENSPRESTQAGDLEGGNTTGLNGTEASQQANMEASGDVGQSGGFFGQVKEFANSLLRSGLSGVGQGVQSLGTLSNQIRERTGGASDLGLFAQVGDPTREGADQSIFNNIGQAIEDTAQELFPDNPEIQNNFVNSTFPQALGSTISFVASGAVGGTPLAAINGGFQLGQTAFEEAKAEGADDDTAMTAFLTNLPLGGLEAFPVSKFFSRLNKSTGGTLTSVLKQGAIGGVEEAVQETTQQALSNVAAQNLYDESRQIIEGVGEGGAAGFAVGLLLNSIGAKVGDMRSRGNLTAEEQQSLDKTEELIEEKRQQISEQQDTATEQVQAELEFADSVTPSTETRSESEESLDTIPESPTEQDEGNGRQRGAFTTQQERGTLNEDFKQEFQEKGKRLYDPVADETTKGIAVDYVDQHGIEGAKLRVFKDQTDLTLAQRVAVGQEVMGRLDQQYNELKGQDKIAASNKLDEQIDFANRVYKFGTELGRAVRAFAYHSSMSPEAFVRIYDDQIKDAGIDPDSKVADQVRKKATAAKKKPEGFQREEAILEVMDFIARQSPVSKTDIGISIAYANILSGHETQLVNFGSTALNTIMETATMVASNPSLIPQATMGLYQGFSKGMRDALNIVKTGKITGSRRTTKLDDIPNVLENVDFQGVFKFANGFKYVRRVMAANDVMFFKAAEESRARMLAKSMAKKEGGTEAEIRARVEQIMGTSEQQMERFKSQARAEGLTPDIDQALEMAQQEGLSGRQARSRAKKITNDFQRRVDELAEQQRSSQVRDESTEFGLRSTFNNKPEGFLGAVAENINRLSKQFPIVKAVVPFTNVVSNVTNRMIDYTPLGWTRLKQWSKDSSNPEFGSDEWKQQLAKSALGVMGLSTVAAISALSMDEEDPFIEFTGRGPDNFRDRFQLQESGWKEYSLKVGDAYISYKETPMALGVGLVANYTDAIKYENMSQESALNRAAYVINSAPQTVLGQSFLTGLQDLFTNLSQENIVQDENIFGSAIGKVRAFAIPNAMKQIDQIFDPKVYTDNDITEALIRDIPIVRSMKGKPIINVLGEPIRNDYDLSERLLDRFLSVRDSDPVWRTITEKQAFISSPGAYQVRVQDRSGQTRSMTPEEHYEYIKQSGQLIRRTLRANIPRIRNMSDGEAQEFVSNVVNNHRGQVKERMEGLIRSGRAFD